MNLKRYIRYIILAVGFLISTAFYVKEGADQGIELEKVVESEAAGVLTEAEDESEAAELSKGEEELFKEEALSEEEQELIRMYVREVMGEYISAESLRREYAREHNELLKQLLKQKAVPELDSVEVQQAGQGQQAAQGHSVTQGQMSGSSRININMATAEELTEINGIGIKKAEEIVRYREVNGIFLSIEELKNVNGIKGSLFEKIKEFVTV